MEEVIGVDVVDGVGDVLLVRFVREKRFDKNFFVLNVDKIFFIGFFEFDFVFIFVFDSLLLGAGDTDNEELTNVDEVPDKAPIDDEEIFRRESDLPNSDDLDFE